MGNLQSQEWNEISTYDDHRDCLRDNDNEPPTLQHVADKIKNGDISQIVILAGAGISVAAGIPDFRSPGSGLYDNLGKYQLPSPEAIFDIDFFDQNPFPFFRLSTELFPGKFRPTLTHYFLTLLHQKEVLRRVFTQNIDTLESVAGLPEDKYVACHGNFSTATCRKCKTEYTQQWMKEQLFNNKKDAETDTDTETDSESSDVEAAVLNIPIPLCTRCGGIVKPDITFFGESLPPRFEELVVPDSQRCDLLLVLGTSLQVYPVGRLPDVVGPWVPRVLFNRDPVHIAEKCKMSEYESKVMGLDKVRSEQEDDEDVVDSGFWFDLEENYRDVFAQGNCDDTVKEFVDLLGWTKELEILMQEGNARFDAAQEVEEMKKGEVSKKEEESKDGTADDTSTKEVNQDQDKEQELSNLMEKTNIK